MAEPEIQIRPEPPLDGPTAGNGHVRWNYQDDDRVDLAPYLRVLRERWRTLAAVTILASAVTAAVTGLLLPEWYRATAVIRPIATPAVESRISGVLGGLGGGLGQLGGLAATLGTGSNDAEEYIAILRGFGFNVSLAERHHLAPELLKPWSWPLSLLLNWKDPDWGIYRALKKRFDCEYSMKTGNITLHFEARKRRDAERILGWYISDLRDLLRAREISGASSAIESLKEEARSSPDAVLRAQLYELVAKQVQRKKMAQVEADFAFRVLDPSAASDRPYSPSVLLDSALAGLLAALGLAVWTAFSPPSGKHSVAPIAERRSQV